MYDIEYTDGTKFLGGEPSNTKWDEQLPNKQIQKLTCWINENEKYQFERFENYVSIVEKIKGIINSIEMVSKWIICGRIGKRVYEVIFDLKEGRITQTVTPFGGEYYGKPVLGWKIGLLNPEIGPKLKRITL